MSHSVHRGKSNAVAGYGPISSFSSMKGMTRRFHDVTPSPASGTFSALDGTGDIVVGDEGLGCGAGRRRRRTTGLDRSAAQATVPVPFAWRFEVGDQIYCESRGREECNGIAAENNRIEFFCVCVLDIIDPAVERVGGAVMQHDAYKQD